LGSGGLNRGRFLAAGDKTEGEGDGEEKAQEYDNFTGNLLAARNGLAHPVGGGAAELWRLATEASAVSTA